MIKSAEPAKLGTHFLSSFSFQLGQKGVLWNSAGLQLSLNLFPSLPAVARMERI